MKKKENDMKKKETPVNEELSAYLEMNDAFKIWDDAGLLVTEKDTMRKRQLALDLDKIMKFMMKKKFENISETRYGVMIPIYIKCFTNGCYPSIEELTKYLEDMQSAVPEGYKKGIGYYAIDTEIIFQDLIAESLISGKKYKTPEELLEDMKKHE